MANAYADLATLKSGGVLNISSTGFDSRLLALLEEASRWIDNYCNRHFFVLNATRRFDGGVRELPVPDLISVATLRTDDDQDRIYEVTWDEEDYLLYPLNAQPQQPWGRPYTRVLADAASGCRQAFPPGKATVEIVGKWGYREAMRDSGADIDQGSPVSESDTVFTVSDGGKLAAGMTLLIGDEQVYVSAVAGNDLTVFRGVNGTAVSVHPDEGDILIYSYPGSVVEACLLLASRMWQRRGGGQAAGPAVRDRALDIDPEVGRLLSPYRRAALGLGV
jgi:hypothetical protein